MIEFCPSVDKQKIGRESSEPPGFEARRLPLSSIQPALLTLPVVEVASHAPPSADLSLCSLLTSADVTPLSLSPTLSLLRCPAPPL